MISSSLRPFMMTAFNLIRLKLAFFAAAMPARTVSKSPVLVSALNFSSLRESRLILIRSKPESARVCAYFSSLEPLVVNVSSFSEVEDLSWPNSLKSQSTSRLTSGSPPVIRTFSTPSSQNARNRKTISSNVSNCWRGMKVISSSMQ